MGDVLETTQNLQRKSHQALLKLLNNIGVIGSILAAIADIVFVIIMVCGVNIHTELSAVIIFAVVNALIGILINILLRYQGQRYAELENEALCSRFYHKEVKEQKFMSMRKWMICKTIEDFFIKGATTSFSIFGIVYISIAGSKNPIQILLTCVTLILFACFGLMGMNSAYTRFYNVQVPYMELRLSEGEANVDTNQATCDNGGCDDRAIVDIPISCKENEVEEQANIES